jgi:tRNA pseudouridine65 synthase
MEKEKGIIHIFENQIQKYIENFGDKHLEIIYQDDHLVAINKPNGLLVHRTAIAAQETVFAMQLLRNQLKQHVFPLHRLDRKTSGVLLFALNKEMAKAIQPEIVDHRFYKTYLAIVRGYFPDAITVDYALTNDRNKQQEAITRFKTLKKTEIDLPFGKHPTSRYSLIEAYPQTGRQHQIRKHCKHLKHPIIGDRPYGCNKQNKLFKEKWGMMTTMLHASILTFFHPALEKR